jgi:hypothetical protein
VDCLHVSLKFGYWCTVAIPLKLNIPVHLGPDSIAGYRIVWMLYCTIIFLADRTAYPFFVNYIVLHV